MNFKQKKFKSNDIIIKIMSIKLYGQSDDNIYAEGIINGQFSHYESHKDINEILCYTMSNEKINTVVIFYYSKPNKGIWGINVLKKGTDFDYIDFCEDEDADIYSDILYLNKNVDKIYCVHKWTHISLNDFLQNNVDINLTFSRVDNNIIEFIFQNELYCIEYLEKKNVFVDLHWKQFQSINEIYQSFQNQIKQKGVESQNILNEKIFICIDPEELN